MKNLSLKQEINIAIALEARIKELQKAIEITLLSLFT